MVSAPQRRAGADLLLSKGVSLRRCARLFGRSRASLRYRRRPLAGDGIAERVQVLAQINPRYGYRRVWIQLRRENRLVNRKRVHRLFKVLQLAGEIAQSAEVLQLSRRRDAAHLDSLVLWLEHGWEGRSRLFKPTEP